jgi:hypothetical protein
MLPFLIFKKLGIIVNDFKKPEAKNCCKIKKKPWERDTFSLRKIIKVNQYQ